MPNLLAREKSPYLLQHADNPIDWYPWGEEAFDKARHEEKPVFLSIGYSTCHWCHVMAEESFEDPQVAELLNDGYVSIKVDREERPDIDQVYMTVCQMLTGRGGWPLTIIMTPEKQPFFAGTYIPKEDRYGLAGLKTILPRVTEMWNNNRDEVLDTAKDISRGLQKNIGRTSTGTLDEDILTSAFKQFQNSYDPEYGGFGRAPKFPALHQLLFLLRYWKRTGEQQALDMVTSTLNAIHRGGIYDQLGFGIHRYATDQKWKVPHFEKMLYDQAMLILTATETWQCTHDPEWQEVAEETVSYIQRDMTSPDGAFFSAEDADSEGGEGTFYLWTLNELRRELSGDDFDFLRHIVPLKKDGNFAGSENTNIIYQYKEWDELANKLNTNVEDVRNQWSRIRKQLFDAREKRTRPHRDDKILTDWNGLMIASLSLTGRVFRHDRALQAARNAAAFIHDHLVDKRGYLLHRFRDGEAAVSGFADDYAFFIWGLLELYRSTFESDYLEQALYWQSQMDKLFRDEQNGGYYHSGTQAETLLVRQKESVDGAMPSAVSVTAYNLLRLNALTGTIDFRDKADQLFSSVAQHVSRSPMNYAMLLSAFHSAVEPPQELVISDHGMSEETRHLLDKLNRKFLPNTVVLVEDKQLQQHAPFLADMHMTDNKPTFYLCQQFQCERPVHRAKDILENF